MIPVIAIPIVNRADLLFRCVRSIDYPVAKLVVVQNGNDAAVNGMLVQFDEEGDYDLRVHRPGRNLGVAASWNWIMRENPAEYWLLVGNDIQFTPGDLKLIDEGVRRHPEMVIRPANWGHSLFAVRPRCLETAGYFDQNFFPAYMEDCDHMRRINLLGLPWADIGKAEDETEQCRAVHGDAPTWGSSTIYADPELLRRNAETHARNFEYYKSKWGGGPGEETFDHPFNNPEWPVSRWEVEQPSLA